MGSEKVFGKNKAAKEFLKFKKRRNSKKDRNQPFQYEFVAYFKD